MKSWLFIWVLTAPDVDVRDSYCTPEELLFISAVQKHRSNICFLMHLFTCTMTSRNLASISSNSDRNGIFASDLLGSKFLTSDLPLCIEMATFKSPYINDVLCVMDFLICHRFVPCDSTSVTCFLHSVNKEQWKTVDVFTWFLELLQFQKLLSYISHW